MYRFWPAVFVLPFLPNDRVRPCSNMPRGDSCGSPWPRASATHLRARSIRRAASGGCTPLRSAPPGPRCPARPPPSIACRADCAYLQRVSPAAADSRPGCQRRFNFPGKCVIVRLIQLEGCSVVRNGWPMGVPLKFQAHPQPNTEKLHSRRRTPAPGSSYTRVTPQFRRGGAAPVSNLCMAGL